MRTWPVTYADPSEFEAGFTALRAEFDIPESFPAEVEQAAAAATPREFARTDLTHVPFVAIDPAGSRDLDQAYYAERRSSGYRLLYAISDVGAFITPDDPVDVESHGRGVTVYAPDKRSPLHPPSLSEHAASLVPGQQRPAVVWSIDLDDQGLTEAIEVFRATIENRQALAYADAQRCIDEGTGPPSLGLLKVIGQLRIQEETRRGGVSLSLPSQYVSRRDGSYHVGYETTLPVEQWNAQVSLLTGMAGARLMIDAGFGLLRTLPPPSTRTLAILRRKSRALGIPFGDETSYADWVRSLDPHSPPCLALLNQATAGLRGAGYQVFGSDGADPIEHAAIAAPYAHVTAPLRRLADRYASELAVAICAGREPPGWAVEGIEQMPEVMAATVRKERSFSRAVIDFTEALAMQHRIGEYFEAVVVDVNSSDITLQLIDPAVVTRSNRTDLRLGEELMVKLVICDPATRQMTFAVE